MHESEFVLDWLDSNHEETPITVESIDSKARRKSVEKKAKSRANNDELTFTEKTKNTREHRQNEIDTNASKVEKNTSTPQQGNGHTKPEIKSSEVVYLPRRRPKKGN
jgi:hypothetical protein